MDYGELVHQVKDQHRRLSQYLGVQWAPKDVPMKRRLQTAAATAWICLILFGEMVSIVLFLQLLYSRWWWVALLYAAWMLQDIDVCNRGGRKIEWVRNWTWWKFYRDYFPIELKKTAELDPTKNYLFACFPHGVMSSGAFGSFATNALDFNKLFPGTKSHIVTLGGHFLVPFFRDLVLALGMCSASKEGIMHLLNPKRFQGNCVTLIVGGAAEALDSHSGECKVVLKKRKGFVRVAMTSGASLVPVFSFGETDVYRSFNNPKDSILRRIQEKIRTLTGVSPVFPIGRGVFQYSYGFIPIRSPITTVVGAPLEVKRNLDPTDEEVDKVHAEFTQKLVGLFESEKSKYVQDYENVHLTVT